MRPRPRRRDWIEKRKARGQEYPLPADVMVVNAMSVSAPAKRVEHIVRRAVREDGVIMWFGSEGYKAHVRALVGSDYDVIQFGVGHSEAMAGTFVVTLKDRVHIHEDTIELRVGSDKTREGGGIRTRYTIQFRATIDPGTPHAWTDWFEAGHTPPPRAPSAWEQFMGRLRDGRGSKFGDMNGSPAQIERWLRRKVRAVGVLAAAFPHWMPVGEARAVDVGGDHLANVVTLFPKRNN